LTIPCGFNREAKMRLRNLTPVALTIAGVRYPPEPIRARVQEDATVAGQIELAGHQTLVPLSELAYGSISGLPAPERGTLLVVTRPVAEALAASEEPLARNDIVIPFPPLRDITGKIVGGKGLARLV
jgi:hypothetical protein